VVYRVGPSGRNRRPARVGLLLTFTRPGCHKHARACASLAERDARGSRRTFHARGQFSVRKFSEYAGLVVGRTQLHRVDQKATPKIYDRFGAATNELTQDRRFPRKPDHCRQFQMMVTSRARMVRLIGQIYRRTYVRSCTNFGALFASFEQFKRLDI